jgi:aspartate aminotransferase-like enzyme
MKTNATVLLILAAVLWATPASAQPFASTAYPVVRMPSMTVAAIPLAFTAAQKMSDNGVPVNQCIGRVETDQVRIGVRGILTPSSTAGMLVNVGDVITLNGWDNIDRFFVIKVTNNATIKWSCTAERR